LECSLNPDQLRSFLAVCEHGSFTRAGEVRFRTQPAVSRQIKQLEQALGLTLFERIGKSVRLTDAGRALRPLAEGWLGQMERIAECVFGHRRPGRGRLRIGASTTPGYYVLPHVLGEFHRTHPDVEIAYTVDNSLVIERLLVRNEIDLGFVGGHLSDRTLLIEPLMEDEIVCFCGAGHPLARRQRITVTVLDDETWVVREPGSATRQLFERWLSSAGGRLHRVIELNSPEAIQALVREGIGVSFLSLAGLRDDFRAGSLRRLRVAGLRLRRPILVVRHPEKHLSPAMTAFLALAQRPAARPPAAAHK